MLAVNWLLAKTAESVDQRQLLLAQKIIINI
jgi:hypothetical protein